MNELIINNEDIKNMIYEIRGKQVIFDKDLAVLYSCVNGTKTINQAVKRHKDRFLEDFYFQVTSNEYKEFLRSQTGTLELEQGKYSKYLPYCFTEEGVAMLSAVLKTPNAAIISVNIMRAFVLMRKYISSELIEQKYINNMVLKHDNEIRLLQETFNNFKPSNNEIYFDGQIYDAYSKIMDLISEAKNKLIIINSYADKKVLDMISYLNIKVILIVKSKTLLRKMDIDNYYKQYDNLIIIYNDSFHDRYLIIDDSKVYHLGASINYIGTKNFFYQ